MLHLMSALAAAAALAAAQPFLPADFLARTPFHGDRKHLNDPWNSDRAIEHALKACPVAQSLRADLRGGGDPLWIEVRRCRRESGGDAFESGGALVLRDGDRTSSCRSMVMTIPALSRATGK